MRRQLAVSLIDTHFCKLHDDTPAACFYTVLHSLTIHDPHGQGEFTKGNFGPYHIILRTDPTSPIWRGGQKLKLLNNVRHAYPQKFYVRYYIQ